MRWRRSWPTRQADERAAGQRVRVGAAFPGQVRQEEQAVAAGRDVAGRGGEVAERHAGRERVAEPAEAAGGRQHHRHQVPAVRARRGRRRGPARAARRSGGRSAAKITPDVPSDSATVPASTAPTPTAFAAWSPPPATTGVPARRPVAPAAPAVTVAGELRALERRRQPAAVDPERVEDLGRPVAGRQVEQDRAGAVGLVDRVVAGEPQPDVVLRQQDVGDPGPDVRLVVADPDELRSREAGQRVVAGDRDEPLRPDGGPDRVALGGGALVVPQDRRPEDAVRVVQQHEAVHLAGQPDRGDVARPGCRSRPGRTGSRRSPRPTTARVLLAPERLRDVVRVLGDADPGDRARLVDEDGLRRRGRDVDPEDVAHRPVRRASVGRGSDPRSRSAVQIAWFTAFSSSSWRPDTGLAGRCRRTRLGLARRRALRRPRGSPCRAARSSPHSAPSRSRSTASRRSTRAAATRSARASVSIPPMWAWKRSSGSMLWRRSLASKLKPPVVKPPPSQDLVHGERQLVDRVRELVGVPAVLGVAAVGVDRAEEPVARPRTRPRGGSCGPASVAWLASMFSRYSSSRPCRTRKPWIVADVEVVLVLRRLHAAWARSGAGP